MAWLCMHGGFVGTVLPALPANGEEAQVGLGQHGEPLGSRACNTDQHCQSYHRCGL